MKKCLNKKWIARMGLVLWLCLIFAFSGQNGEESSGLSAKVGQTIVNTVDKLCRLNLLEQQKEAAVEKITLPIRKLAHMLEYAILALLAYISFSKYVISIIIVFGYAMTDEFHQLYIPGRAGQFTDVLIDTTGGLIMLVCIWVVLNKIQYRKR